ncbi:hypothetical protein NG798_17430 [Ancylothrix sp. C2]|uniref:hypothetical protein n=1 Tax=Ancylothrix sp. D3o TaxID=2953691 RepID=UPI0021BA7EFB|nr:hypothetical protein [Ancylothrix sp. D3o]MCT7951589.1 hypothetical protein [Ancylothrix sp. D3o]
MTKNRHWLQTIESLSLVGCFAGSVAAVLSEQILYAVAPVSLSLALNLSNRRFFEQKNTQLTTTALQQINQQIERLDSAKKEWSGAIQILIQQLETQAKNIDPTQYINRQNTDIDILKNKQDSLEIAVGTLGEEIHLLNQQFKNRPELQQIENLAEIILALRQTIDRLPSPQNSQPQIETKTSHIPSKIETTDISFIAEINQQLQTLQTPYEYELVTSPNPHQTVIEEALETAQNRLIIASPWMRQQPIPPELLEKIKAFLIKTFLNRSITIQIGWTNGEQNLPLQQLQELAQEYPGKIVFKQIESHENFIVCDESFAWVGSHSVLNKSAATHEPEVVVRTTDPLIIQELIQRFNEAKSNLETGFI